MTETFEILNQSTAEVTPDTILQIETALSDYERLVEAAWGEAPWRVGRGGHPQHPIICSLQDTYDADAGVLAYHSTNAEGVPVIYGFVGNILGAGGTWTDGPLSVSVALSHEFAETRCDPGANRMAADANGDVWALEVGDPTESDTFKMGNGVEVSNFVFPSFFAPGADGPYDMLGIVPAPFSIMPNGYMLRYTDSDGFQPVWGDELGETDNRYGTSEARAEKLASSRRIHARNGYANAIKPSTMRDGGLPRD